MILKFIQGVENSKFYENFLYGAYEIITVLLNTLEKETKEYDAINFILANDTSSFSTIHELIELVNLILEKYWVDNERKIEILDKLKEINKTKSDYYFFDTSDFWISQDINPNHWWLKLNSDESDEYVVIWDECIFRFDMWGGNYSKEELNKIYKDIQKDYN